MENMKCRSSRNQLHDKNGSNMRHMMAIQLPRVNLPDRQESLLTRKNLVILNMLLHERIVLRTADQLLRSHLSSTWRISMMAP